METFLKIAQGATEVNEHALAAAALTAAGQDLAAASALQSAAEFSRRDGAFRDAARAYGSEAKCLMVAGQYKRAVTAFEKSALGYAAGGEPDQVEQARMMAEAARRFASSPIGSCDGFD